MRDGNACSYRGDVCGLIDKNRSIIGFTCSAWVPQLIGFLIRDLG
jgi:hypothetical protein